jgi:hypothetical protein
LPTPNYSPIIVSAACQQWSSSTLMVIFS